MREYGDCGGLETVMLIGRDGSGAPVWQWEDEKHDEEMPAAHGLDGGSGNMGLFATEAREAAESGKLKPVFLETTLEGADGGELLLLTDVSASFTVETFAPWATEDLATETALNSRPADDRRGGSFQRFAAEWQSFMRNAMMFRAATRCPGLAGCGMRFGTASRNGDLDAWMRENGLDLSPAFELRITAPAGRGRDEMAAAAGELCALLAEAGPTTATARRDTDKSWTEMRVAVYAELAARREAAALDRAAALGRGRRERTRGP